MTLEPRDLAAHLVPEVTEGRLARQWASLDRKLPRPAGVASVWLRVVALAAPAVALAAWFVWSPGSLPASGAVVESSDTPVSMQLRDGSRLELAAQTRLRVLRDQPAAVEVELADGRASFDVKHVDNRAFSVRAGSVAVHVVGTKFDVVKVIRPEGEEIEVSVTRGVVEVERADRGDVRRLTAGEKFSVWIPADKADKEAAPSPTTTHSPEVPAPAPKAAPAHTPSPRAHAPAVVAKPAAVHDEEAEEAPEDVRALFLRANVARRAGLMEDAADAYAEMLRRFPHDGRAAVSAFELGRIRMDALGDPRGAAQAFADSLRLGKRAQFREDALARLAIASDMIGDLESCKKHRERYLADFPTGVHASSLRDLCGEPVR
jgi:TolA-binding protein